MSILDLFTRRNKADKLIENASINLLEVPQTRPDKNPFFVEFDSSVITDAVKDNIRKHVEQIKEIKSEHVDKIYEAALQAEMVGGNMFLLSNTIQDTCGINKQKAGQICRYLHSNANAAIMRVRQEEIGCTEAVWLYSAPCAVDAREPTSKEKRMNAAHKNANGKRYKIEKGMFLNGKWTWPGCEEGCKCVSRTIVPLFDKV